MGMSLPLQMKGTLQKKLSRVNVVHKRILEMKEGGIRESRSLDRLLHERAELETDIDRHLLNGEQIGDPLLDYCFRHFWGMESHNLVGMGVEDSYTTVYDTLPFVKRFVKTAEALKGEKILLVIGDKKERNEFFDNSVLEQGSQLETGVISDKPIFSIEETFRYLHVPVKRLFVFDSEKGTWRQGKTVYNSNTKKQEPYGNLLYINHDIFKHPLTEPCEGETVWRTNHSKITYIEGGPPAETAIYLGNALVERMIKEMPPVEKVSNVKVSNPFS